jgi:hypothetical protein
VVSKRQSESRIVPADRKRFVEGKYSLRIIQIHSIENESNNIGSVGTGGEQSTDEVALIDRHLSSCGWTDHVTTSFD